MTLGHWVGSIPYETLPEYKSADLLEVYKRLAAKHKQYPTEEVENAGG